MLRVLKFEQPNCNPCKLVSEFLDKEGIDYEHINAFDDPDMASNFGIMSVPTTFVVDENGGIVFSTQGFKPDQLQTVIDLVRGN